MPCVSISINYRPFI